MNQTQLEVGELTYINGQWMRYMGGGRFSPAQPESMGESLLAKRFDTADCGPLLRRDA